MVDPRVGSNPQQGAVGYRLADRYQVLRQLAKQHRRLTYLARDLVTQQVVVIKLILFNQAFQSNEWELFGQEASVLQTINHPSVPRYVNHFEMNLRDGSKGFALVQSYVAGRSLQDCLDQGRIFTEAEVKQIAAAVLNILVYLHGLRPPIIHRDIKPANILLVETPGQTVGQVYLIDFGAVAALVSADESTTSTTLGTYGYMPPEQFGGRAIAASDLYSLGMTLIALVTGTHPGQLPRKNLRIQFEEKAQLTPGFADWLKWMTEPGLEHRLVSAEEALKTIHQEQPRSQKPSVVFRRPPGSRVSLHKTASTLEIMIPPTGFKSTVVYVGVGIGLLVLLALGLIGVALGSPLGPALLLLLLTLPIWTAGLGLGLVLIFTLYGRVRLRINQQQIALIYELFRWKFHYPKPLAVKYISQLKYVGQSNGNRAKVHPHLVIAAKANRYKLGSNLLFNLVSFLRITSDPEGFDTLTPPELDWLANELSSWLGLPIARERE